MSGSNNRPIACKMFLLKRAKAEFLVGILLLVCACLAHAQAHIAISGMVTDSTRAPIQGVQIEFRMTAGVRLSAAYLFVNSTVLSFAANPALVGNFLPQVPQNQFSFQASYHGKGWNAGLQGRFGGQQFDDDQNLLPLGRAFSLDAEVSRQLGWHT